MLLGHNSFSNDIDDANIIAALAEGRNEELHAGLRTLDGRHLTDRRFISFFEKRYQHLVNIYATIQGLRSDKEELEVNVTRLCSHLRKDLVDLGKEAYDEDEEYMAPSVIRDLLDQLSELSKRYLGIRTMMDKDPKIEPISLREFDPITRSHRTSTYSVPQYIHKIKKKLLILQDEVRDKKREKENHEKILLTQGLKLGPGRLRLLDLENRSLILPYQDRYEHVPEEMKTWRLPDWRQHLLADV